MLNFKNCNLFLFFIILEFSINATASEYNCQNNLIVKSFDKVHSLVNVKNIGTTSVFLDYVYLEWSGSNYLKKKCDWNTGSLLSNNLYGDTSSISKWLLPDSSISLFIDTLSVLHDTTSLYHISLGLNSLCDSFTVNNTTDIHGNLISSFTCGTDTSVTTISSKRSFSNYKANKLNGYIKIKLNKNGNVVVCYKEMYFGLNGLKIMKKD